MQIALASLVMLLPGVCWWVWFGDRKRDAVETIATILGLSFSAIILAFLLFYLIGLPLLGGFGVALLAVLLFLSVWGIRQKGLPRFTWGSLAAVAGLGVLIGWRLFQARTLVLPNWVDSLHHVLIVRKMVEAGGLTSTLEPYLPGNFYYHFGFHALAAVFSDLSGLDPSQSVLVFGQIITACISLGVYTLVKAASRDKRPALLGALIVTFATRMPGYYFNWGRYTLLMGVFFLPLAMAEILQVQKVQQARPQLITLVLLTVGTLLSHYVTAFLLALFFLSAGLLWVWQNLQEKHWEWSKISPLVVSALVGLTLAAPWYCRAVKYSGRVENMARIIASPLESLANGQNWQYLLQLIGPNSGFVVLGLALIGMVLSRNWKNWRSLGIWFLAVLLFALPHGNQIAGFRSDYYALMLFLPVSAFSAGFLVWLLRKTKLRFPHRRILLAAQAALVGLLIFWGAYLNYNPLNPDLILANQADLTALQWIEDHVPRDARFFINTTMWGNGTSRGVDGGAWIFPYTGRWTIVPTIYYPFGKDLAYTAEVKEIGVRAAGMAYCDENFNKLLAEQNLNYIYIRDGVGSMQRASLENCDGIRKIYDASKVSIWLVQ